MPPAPIVRTALFTGNCSCYFLEAIIIIIFNLINEGVYTWGLKIVTDSQTSPIYVASLWALVLHMISYFLTLENIIVLNYQDLSTESPCSLNDIFK